MVLWICLQTEISKLAVLNDFKAFLDYVERRAGTDVQFGYLWCKAEVDFVLATLLLFNIYDQWLYKVVVFKDPNHFFFVSLADPNKVIQRIADQLQIFPSTCWNEKSHLEWID